MAGTRGILRALLSALACGAILAPAGADPATRTVSLTANQFAPALLDRLQTGDTVQWNWLDGIHDVTAYQNGQFSSGQLGPSSQYSITYLGGVVKYRCTIHSSLSGTQCFGMCGVLTDRPIDLNPPEVFIDKPAQNGEIMIGDKQPGLSGVYNFVTLQGRATDDVAVFAIQITIYDIRQNGITRGATEYIASCTGCETTSATWELKVSLLPGPYTVMAIAADTSGNVPRTPPRVQFWAI